MRRPILLLAVAALLLAACGSDSDPSGAGESGPDVTFATTPAGSTDPAGPDAGSPDTSDPATPQASDTAAPDDTATPDGTVALAADQVAFEQFVGDLPNPVDLAWRDGDPTLFVVLQGGSIVPVRDGVAGAPVLELTDDFSSGGEQGLLGLAFHPSQPLAYVNYTDGDGDTVIAEYQVGDDGTLQAASTRQVLAIDQPHSNHNGGDLAFGPDGYLYIGMGDGGSANDPDRRSLNVGQLLGKMLRIDPLAAGAEPYTVPADNPFVGVDGAQPEIWAVGLRNPWRFNFDRQTGDLWIADVGQGEWEEVDLARAVDGGGRGLNFGWSAWEGTHRYNSDQPEGGVTMPIFEYAHGDAGCSVTGGDVYRGTAIPSLVGWYLLSDACSGIVTALHATDGVLAEQLVLGQVNAVSSINAGPDGEMYVLSLVDSAVYKIVAA